MNKFLNGKAGVGLDLPSAVGIIPIVTGKFDFFVRDPFIPKA